MRAPTVCHGNACLFHPIDWIYEIEDNGVSALCRCPWHDSYGHAITFPQSLLLDAISADGLRWHWYQLSLSLCVSISFSQFNIMSAWPEGFCQPVYSSKVESQQNHSRWKHTITIWKGFIMNVFRSFSVLSCGFSINRFAVFELNFKCALNSTMKSSKPIPNCLIIFITWVIT